MVIKILSICFLSLISMQPPTLSPEKIAGKYGIAGDEFICLELMKDKSFALTISSCSADNYVEGKYELEGEKIRLSSDLQPTMKLKKLKQEKSDKFTLKFTSNESMLLPRIEISMNGNEKKYKLNTKGELNLPEAKANSITVHYDGIPSTEMTIEGGRQAYHVQLEFQNLSSASIKDQVWIYSKKRLTYTDEKGNKVVLRKTTQCWFDYMEN